MSQSTQTARHTQQQSKRVRHTKQQLIESLEALAQRRDAADAKAAELAAQLEEVKAALAKAEADVAILRTDAACVRLCSPGGPPAAEALQPAVDGVVRVWFMIKGDGYLVAFGGQSVEGKSWTMKKFTTGETYRQTETDCDLIACDCPGGAKYGPRCSGGKGCKHARMIRTARALLSNTGPKFTTAPAGASQEEQTPIKRLTMAQILEDSADQFAGVSPAA